MAERYPLYEKADIVIDSGHEPPEKTADKVLLGLQNYTASNCAKAIEP